MNDESVIDNPTALALILKGVEKLQQSLSRYKVLGAVLAVALTVAASGWWLTAHDHSATSRNGRVADCRATAFARRLDDFSMVANPAISTEDRRKAGERIASGVPLEAAYAACSGHPASVCRDGSASMATGRGTCSGHGGVKTSVTTTEPR